MKDNTKTHTVELTELEITYLYHLTCRVSGDVYKSGRRTTDIIGEKLSALMGVHPTDFYESGLTWRRENLVGKVKFTGISPVFGFKKG